VVFYLSGGGFLDLQGLKIFFSRSLEGDPFLFHFHLDRGPNVLGRNYLDCALADVTCSGAVRGCDLHVG
jgi:hypothetical protein